MRFENPQQKPDRFEKVGEGTQKFAYRNEDDPGSIYLEFKHEHSNVEMKAMFYIQKIAHLIFPDETVAVQQVGSVTNKNGRITNFARTEFVSQETDPVHLRMQEMYRGVGGDYSLIKGKEKKEIKKYYTASLNDSRVRAFLRQFAKAGLENRLAMFGRQDRIETGNDKFKYVDIAPPWYIDEEYPETKELLFDPKKLKKAIEQLPEASQKKAFVYFDRLLDLCRQVGFEVDT